VKKGKERDGKSLITHFFNELYIVGQIGLV